MLDEGSTPYTPTISTMDKNAWQSTYRVVRHDPVIEDGDLGTHYGAPIYELQDHDGNVCGKYRDYSYAIKQGRRKYKKLVKLIERKLMS